MITISWPFSGLVVVFIILLICAACAMSYRIGELNAECRKAKYEINVLKDGDRKSKYVG